MCWLLAATTMGVSGVEAGRVPSGIRFVIPWAANGRLAVGKAAGRSGGCGRWLVCGSLRAMSAQAYGADGVGAAGRVRRTIKPWGWALCALAWPPCWAAMRATSGRPRPEPWVLCSSARQKR